MKNFLNLLFIALLVILSNAINLKTKQDPKVAAVDNNPSPKTVKLALDQTKAARNMFYSPNNALVKEMKSTCKNLNEFTQELFRNAKMQKLRDIRVINGGGVLNGKSYKDLLSALDNVCKGKGSANDRMAMISYMGDLGTILVDFHTDERIAGNEDLKALNNLLSEFLQRKNLPDVKVDNVKIFKDERSGLHYAPSKKKQRANGAVTQRAGILNTGPEADKQLKEVTNGKTISYAKWPIQKITKARLDTTVEPWAGHMSGSLPEILFFWDHIIGENPMISIEADLIEVNKHKLNSPQRRARAAASAGMLVALGFHSALETLEGAYDYLGKGQKIRESIDEIADKEGTERDNAVLNGNGESTNKMNKLFNEFTNKIVKFSHKGMKTVVNSNKANKKK